MPPLQGSSEQGLLFAPYGLSLLVAQYAALFVAVASTHTDSPACLPGTFPGAGYGWDAGVCFTEEQVHARCPLAPSAVRESARSPTNATRICPPTHTKKSRKKPRPLPCTRLTLARPELCTPGAGVVPVPRRGARRAVQAGGLPRGGDSAHPLAAQ